MKSLADSFQLSIICVWKGGSEIDFFDDENSTKTVENTKIKPFEKLTKVPKRSNLWKAAYNKALKMLN